MNKTKQRVKRKMVAYKKEIKMQIYRVETQRMRIKGREKDNTSINTTKHLLLPYNEFKINVFVLRYEEIESITRGFSKRKHHRFRQGKC
jgi:hypothetical protein